MKSFLIVILGALFLALPTFGRAVPQTATQTGRCFPQGLSDPKGRRAFTRSGTGGIDSIDLKTGRLNWNSSAASVPLFVDDAHLLAFKYLDEDTIQIVKLDIETGRPVMVSDPINFPAGIEVSATRDEKFGLQAQASNRTLELRWRGRTFYDGGAPPPPDVAQKWQKQLGGIFKVDLATGNVTSQSADDISIASPAPRLGSKMDGAVDWKIKGEPVTLSVKQEPNGQAVFMKRADAQRTKLLSGPDLVADVTDDGLFVLVRSKGSSPSLWHLFSAETGREIGAVPYETGAQQACVIDSRLFYLVPKVKATANDRGTALKAIDLHSGQVLWSRDLIEAGGGSRPLPPAAYPRID